MCFSEEVSFYCAGALTVASAACFISAEKIRSVTVLRQFPFFLYSASHRGVQWLFYKGRFDLAESARAAQDLYVVIAFVIWPFWFWPIAVSC